MISRLVQSAEKRCATRFRSESLEEPSEPISDARRQIGQNPPSYEIELSNSITMMAAERGSQAFPQVDHDSPALWQSLLDA